jgi:hypothetical protein
MKIYVLTILIYVVLFSIESRAQENEFTRSSIKTGFGAGINEGFEETGTGFVYSVGYQKSFGKEERFRINPKFELNIRTNTSQPLFATRIVNRKKMNFLLHAKPRF